MCVPGNLTDKSYKCIEKNGRPLYKDSTKLNCQNGSLSKDSHLRFATKEHNISDCISLCASDFLNKGCKELQGQIRVARSLPVLFECVCQGSNRLLGRTIYCQYMCCVCVYVSENVFAIP